MADSDEEDNYDSEEEDERSSKRRKTDHDGGGSQFVALEAEEDDDDDGHYDDEDDPDMAGFIDEGDAYGDSHQRTSDKRELEKLKAQMDAIPSARGRSEDYLNNLAQRYASTDDDRTIGAYDEDVDDDDEGFESVGMSSSRLGGPMANATRHQTQYPTVKDPKLFLVKCKHGKERLAVLTIMQKFFNLEQTSTKLQIFFN